jgi:hypothetical protein
MEPARGKRSALWAESGVPSRKLWTTIIPLAVRNRPSIEAVVGQEDCTRAEKKWSPKSELLDEEKEMSKCESGKMENGSKSLIGIGLQRKTGGSVSGPCHDPTGSKRGLTTRKRE